MKYFLTIALFVILSVDSFSQTTIKLGSQEENIYPFDLNKPNLYFDCAKSKNNFNDIDIFGMGEATLGTKEFFEIKAKRFEYFVTNYNYKVFGIEAFIPTSTFLTKIKGKKMFT